MAKIRDFYHPYASNDFNGKSGLRDFHEILYSSFCFIQLIPELQEMLDGGKIEMVKVIAAANQKDG